MEGKVIEGYTPLLAAAIKGHLDVVKLLIERDAERRCSNVEGQPRKRVEKRREMD